MPVDAALAGVGLVGRVVVVGVRRPAAWAGVGLTGREAKGVLLCIGCSLSSNVSKMAELVTAFELWSLTTRQETPSWILRVLW